MTVSGEVTAMIQQAVDHFGRIDLLINNAGQGYSSLVENINIEMFQYLFTLNVLGPLVAIQAVIPLMRQQGGGLIINISSGTSVAAYPRVGAYSATKRALNGISLTARAELAQDNIRVSLLHPYMTATNFFDNLLAKDDKEGIPTRPGAPVPDSPESVAQKILEIIDSEAAETIMHEWKNGRK